MTQNLLASALLIVGFSGLFVAGEVGRLSALNHLLAKEMFFVFLALGVKQLTISSDAKLTVLAALVAVGMLLEWAVRRVAQG
jgi:hypothetical protein